MNTTDFWRPSRPSRLSDADSLGLVVIILCVFALALIFNGWALMIAIGVLSAHGLVGGTIGLWPAVAVAFLVRCAVGSFGASSAKS